MTFPAGRTLIVPPSQLWSRSRPATWGGSVVPGYPTSNATDGTMTTRTRSHFDTDALTVMLAAAQTPNIFGVFGHNIDAGNIVIFQADGGATLDQGAAARLPNFWLDLRGFELAASASWRVAVNANSRPLAIGQVVIATGFEFEGTLKDPRERYLFWQARKEFPSGITAISASGSLSRTMPLELTVTAEQLEQLLQISDEAGLTGERVVVVPDTRRNDIWLVEWPSVFSYAYPRSDRQIDVSLNLIEENAGVIGV